ncbi:hypothetical protein D9M71_592480 [compost metagenome]
MQYSINAGETHECVLISKLKVMLFGLELMMIQLTVQPFHLFVQLVSIRYYDRASILRVCHNLDQKAVAMLLTDHKR